MTFQVVETLPDAVRVKGEQKITLADFKRGTDLLQLEGGVSVTGFHVAGADTVIALSNGATIEVLGVAATGSIADWFSA